MRIGNKVCIQVGLLLLGWLLAIPIRAAYSIKVELEQYKYQELYLAHYQYGESVMIDTVKRSEAGYFEFKGAERLAEGNYLVILRPKQEAIQLMIPGDFDSLTLKADAQRIRPDYIQIEGSPINQAFYRYLVELTQQRRTTNQLGKALSQATVSEYDSLYQIFRESNEATRQFQLDLLQKDSTSLLALAVQCDIEPSLPIRSDTSRQAALKRYLNRRQHLFDAINLMDPRMAHNPRFFNRLNFYINKLLPPDTDSISMALDSLLQRSMTNPDLFRGMLDKFMALYFKPRIAGQDAIYVYLAERYHVKGYVDWLPKEELQEVLYYSNIFKQILIGQIAPNIQLQKRDTTPIALHDIQADYTVLFFWRPGCGHCKKSLPVLKDVYNRYKSQGVEFLSICNLTGQDTPRCWKYLEENEALDWINAVDPLHKSRFLHRFHAARTPKIYILDKDKRIIIKDIGAEYIEAILNRKGVTAS